MKFGQQVLFFSEKVPGSHEIDLHPSEQTPKIADSTENKVRDESSSKNNSQERQEANLSDDPRKRKRVRFFRETDTSQTASKLHFVHFWSECEVVMACLKAHKLA